MTPLEQSVLIYLVAVIAAALIVRAIYGGPACRRCGCTEWSACAGGCAWVSLDPPVCSRCVFDPIDNPAFDLAEVETTALLTRGGAS